MVCERYNAESDFQRVEFYCHERLFSNGPLLQLSSRAITWCRRPVVLPLPQYWRRDEELRPMFALLSAQRIVLFT